MSELTTLLQNLVRIPSINPMGRPLSGPQYYEYAVTDFLEQYFRKLGVPYERQNVAPLRDNIIARYHAPHSNRTLIFEAHQDTVPVEGMIIDPFGGTVENGRLYGRGSCDIKGGMTSMLIAFARLVRERPAQSCNVIMACVVDEEFTFRGIAEFARRGVKADRAIVSEPTNLNIVNAHKGTCRWKMHTPGRSCHSSSPHQGVNAIYRMGRMLTAIQRYAEEVLPKSHVDTELGSPTLSVGRIEGGVSVNVVPEHCTIEVDRRIVNGEELRQAPRDLVKYLKDVAKLDFPFVCDEPWQAKGPLSSRGSESLVKELGASIRALHGDHQVMTVPYGTDAPVLQDIGIPSVVFGPGDIAQAHTCDEWVQLEEVEKASEILFHFATQPL
jgi:acetylornithine deacetylase